MAFVRDIESKIKITRLTATVAVIMSGVVVIAAFIFCLSVVNNSNKTIYVLSDNTPIMALRTDLEMNRPAEYKAQIGYFHSLFFNLTPDDAFIESQMKKAMYLIDESGIQQYRNMKEKGFYSSILASNSILKLETDSIVLDIPNKTFVFYGKQTIDRKTSKLRRTLITSGTLTDIPRSENNAHGVLIGNWKTLENKDIDFREKY